ncbi:MAG: flagellar hook-basal body complex protein [Janthinobacterium lividum]
MLESIYVGMSGLLGYAKGLRVIANNTANLNTPGFKSASLQFSDQFYSGSAQAGSASLGHGLDTGATVLSLRQGELRQSGNPLDLAIDGQGLFILREPQSGSGQDSLHYSRAGQFVFNDAGLLEDLGSHAEVMGLDDQGGLVPVSLHGLQIHAGKPTSTITFSGNLSSTAASQAVEGITVIDRQGAQHTLRALLTAQTAEMAGNDSPGRWQVQLFEGDRLAATTTPAFENGEPAAASARNTVSYTPQGLEAMTLTLDMSSNVTSFAAGSLSTLAASKQDGVLPGALVGAGFDASGVLVLRYANGQQVQGRQLALAHFSVTDDITSIGSNQFAAVAGAQAQVGAARSGVFGRIEAGSVEISNVDLSQEFTNLMIMQRGYQASSQVISTASELLQQLFSIKAQA